MATYARAVGGRCRASLRESADRRHRRRGRSGPADSPTDVASYAGPCAVARFSAGGRDPAVQTRPGPVPSLRRSAGGDRGLHHPLGARRRPVAGRRHAPRHRQAFTPFGCPTAEALAARLRDRAAPHDRRPSRQRLAQQARLQVANAPPAAPAYDLAGARAGRGLRCRPPPPSPGDVFFDFEGDPFAADERGSEYLFGCGIAGRRFSSLWAHDRDAGDGRGPHDLVDDADRAAGSRPATCTSTTTRPTRPTALLRLAARHGVCEDEVDQLLRDGVFVDLYAVVRSAIRVSQRSYSIKKLEPLYMEAHPHRRRRGRRPTRLGSVVAFERCSTTATPVLERSRPTTATTALHPGAA